MFFGFFYERTNTSETIICFTVWFVLRAATSTVTFLFAFLNKIFYLNKSPGFKPKLKAAYYNRWAIHTLKSNQVKLQKVFMSENPK